MSSMPTQYYAKPSLKDMQWGSGGGTTLKSLLEVNS